MKIFLFVLGFAFFSGSMARASFKSCGWSDISLIPTQATEKDAKLTCGNRAARRVSGWTYRDYYQSEPCTQPVGDTTPCMDRHYKVTEVCAQFECY